MFSSDVSDVVRNAFPKGILKNISFEFPSLWILLYMFGRWEFCLLQEEAYPFPCYSAISVTGLDDLRTAPETRGSCWEFVVLWGFVR